MNALADGDPLLRALQGADASDRPDLIARILHAHAQPIIAAILRTASGGSLPPEDTADIESDIILRLVQRLNRVAQAPEDAAISDFASYVRTVAHHAVEDHRRRLQPDRTRFANRVRYVLTHDARLAIWERAGSVCGLAAWRGRPAVPRAATSLHAPERTGAPAHAANALSPTRLGDLVHTALAAAQGPLAFDQLVDVLAHALQVGGAAPARAVAEGDHEAGDPAAQLVAREDLARLWSEIVALPVRQRQALLLYQRFDDGDSVTRELPVLGLADIRGVAAVLEMPLDAVLRLWNALPLDDLRIAALLGATRQQVINLRKSARERLARRMQRDRR